MENASLTSSSRYYGLGFVLLILFSAWWYYPGTNGDFILDDVPNLEGLAEIQPEHFWHDARQFIVDGNAGMAGRSVSLLSFALQADAWPNPSAFKRVNLILHLVNALLIAYLLLLWGRIQGLPQAKVQVPILIITAIWLLSPIQASTVLYVIQRMTQLTVLFTLLGLIFYSHGRYLCMQGRLRWGYVSATIGIAVMGILAILSKENGALLVVYAAVLELTLWQSLAVPPYWRWWRRIFIYSPVVILLAYFAFVYSYQGYADQAFTMQERLYTQGRILWDYLYKLWLPLTQNFGLFHDGFSLSQSLFNPVSTAVALLAWLVLIALAWWQRRAYPLLAFALLWYLGGHSLESSVVPLQLYFEHRNYLPLLGPVAAVVYFLYLLWQKHARQRRIIAMIAVSWFLLMLFSSAQEIKLWQNPVAQALYWAENHPNSRYAQSHAASTMVKLNQVERADSYYRHMQNTFAEDSSPRLFRLSLHCLAAHIPAPSHADILQQLASSRHDGGTDSVLQHLYQQQKQQQCPSVLSDTLLLEIFQQILDKAPWSEQRKAHTYFLKAHVHADNKAYSQAISAIEHAFAAGLALANDSKIKHITWLLESKRYQAARQAIQQMRQGLRVVDKPSYEPRLQELTQIADFLEQQAAPASW